VHITPRYVCIQLETVSKCSSMLTGLESDHNFPVIVNIDLLNASGKPVHRMLCLRLLRPHLLTNTPNSIHRHKYDYIFYQCPSL